VKLLVRVVALVAIAAILTYGGARLYRRSLPPLPAVVMHDAALGPLVEPTLGDRLRHLVYGSSADHRVAGPKLIALTFDDGPYPVETPVLLAALRDAHVPATFFLIGRDAEQYPGLVRAIAAGGNEIANHTETHPDLASLDDAQVTAEIAGGKARLGRYASDPAIGTLFRPPHGRFRPATLAAAQRAGYDTVLWTDDPGDWRNISSATLAEHIGRYATSPEILLLHNGRPETVDVLSALVQGYRAAGYTFVTAGEIIRRLGPGVLNHAARTPLTFTPD
jgi:peptidoglycan/xylan/chitin deacetylase (PgdA/CDA1 family)